MSSWFRTSALAVVLLAAFATHVGAAAPERNERETGAEPCSATYSVRGVVKAFGPERRTVSIAHEDIPGFMMAMTMSFVPRTPTQLAGLAVGDRVMLTFTAEGDGQLSIDSIRKP